MGWPFAFVAFLYFVWNALILGTTAYVVFWLDRSCWWFLLAFACCGSLPTFTESVRERAR